MRRNEHPNSKLCFIDIIFTYTRILSDQNQRYGHEPTETIIYSPVRRSPRPPTCKQKTVTFATPIGLTNTYHALIVAGKLDQYSIILK